MVKFLILLLIPLFCFGQYVNDLEKITVANIVAKDSVNFYAEMLNGSSALTPYKLPLDSLKKYLEGYIQIALLDTMTYWDDLIFSIANSKTPASGYPDLETFIGGTKLLAFDKNTDQTVYMSGELLHRWKIGTDIDTHIHWAEGATPDSGSVVWGLEIGFAEIGDAFVILDTLFATDAADSIAYHHSYADFGELDMSAYTALTDVSGNFVLRFYRDANAAADTYDHDAYAITVGFHYQIDTFGSRSEYSK